MNEVPDKHAAAATLQPAVLHPDTEADERTLESQFYRTGTFCFLKMSSRAVRPKGKDSVGRLFRELAYPEFAQQIYHSLHPGECRG